MDFLRKLIELSRNCLIDVCGKIHENNPGLTSNAHDYGMSGLP